MLGINRDVFPEDKETTVFISFDVEADGKCAGVHNCIQIGAVLYEENLTMGFDDCRTETKEWCLQQVNRPCPLTMTEFWGQGISVEDRNSMQAKNAVILEHIQANARPPAEVAQELYDWYISLVQQYKRVYFVAKPAAFDWPWLNHLIWTYVRNPVKWPFKAECVSTALGALERIYGWDKVKLRTTRADLPHTHNAVDDAIEQAYSWWGCLEMMQGIKEGFGMLEQLRDQLLITI